jgi:hypothetical protein
MASSLRNLRTELQLDIAEALISSPNGHAALCEWRCTCSFYRDMLAPYVLETVSLLNHLDEDDDSDYDDDISYGTSNCRRRNNDDCASTLLELAGRPYAKHVKKLVYTGFSERNDSYRSIRKVFPSRVGVILSNLGQFGGLSSLAVTCLTNLSLSGYYDDWGTPLLSKAEAVAAETSDTGRYLIHRTYKFLSKNMDHRIKTLKIRDLEPQDVSAFYSEDFHRFLHNIQAFELSFRGIEDIYHDRTDDRYRNYASRLRLYFFDNLRNVLDFAFVANKNGPVKMTMFRYMTDSMPLLNRVHLEWILICPGLVDFLVAKSTTLESISLHNCSGPSASVNSLGITWRELFRKVSNAKPSKLQMFTVKPYRVVPDLLYNGSVSPENMEILTNDLERRQFHYADIDRGEACVRDDVEEMVDSFIQGEDHRAYEELMVIVRANVARLSSRYASRLLKT